MRNIFPVPAQTSLLAPQEANAGGKRAAIEIAEGEKLGRINVVVHGVRILPVRDVVKPSTQRPVGAPRAKTFFKMDI